MCLKSVQSGLSAFSDLNTSAGDVYVLYASAQNFQFVHISLFCLARGDLNIHCLKQMENDKPVPQFYGCFALQGSYHELSILLNNKQIINLMPLVLLVGRDDE